MKNFLENYMEMTSGNESPEIYHKWCGLHVLSTLLGRRVYLRQGRDETNPDKALFTVYPNMYILLVGEPGIKKSTAMDLAWELLYEFRQHCYCSRDSITKQEMARLMGREDSECRQGYIADEKSKFYTQMALICDEFINFLEAANPAQMVSFLTEAFRANHVGVQTKHQGQDEILFPSIHILGGLTKDRTADLVKTKIITSGFSRRCVFVYSEDEAPDIAIPVITREMRQAEAECIKHCKRVIKWQGEMELSDKAAQLYTEIYAATSVKRRATESTALKYFYRSQPEYILKVAMLLCCVYAKPLMKIMPTHLREAMEFMQPIEENLDKLFGSVGRNELAEIGGAIQEFIAKQKSWVKVKQVYKGFWKDASTDEIDRILDTLVRTDRVVREQKKVGDHPIWHYKAKG